MVVFDLEGDDVEGSAAPGVGRLTISLREDDDEIRVDVCGNDAGDVSLRGRSVI